MRHAADQPRLRALRRSTRRRRPARASAAGSPLAAAALVVSGCAHRLVHARSRWSVPLFIAAAIVGSVFPAQRAWQSITRGVARHQRADGHRRDRRDRDRRVVEEAAMVVSLFAAAQWLEAQSLDRARKAIGKLLDLAPTDVLVRDDRGERRIDIEQVDAGRADDRQAGRKDSRSTASSAPAARTSTRRRSPASRCRSKRPKATKCSPAPSTATAR